jgi:hypothetical protein
LGLTYSIDREHCELLVVAEGRITFEDVRHHLEEERDAGGLAYPELIDARSAIPDLSSEDVRQIVRLLERLGCSGRLGPTAVVVPTAFAYGLMRMLEIQVEPVCVIRPFRDYDAAVQWLRELRSNCA